jgi:antitoxin component YwqK of YwqJK toxin-antitoxin module
MKITKAMQNSSFLANMETAFRRQGLDMSKVIDDYQKPTSAAFAPMPIENPTLHEGLKEGLTSQKEMLKTRLSTGRGDDGFYITKDGARIHEVPSQGEYVIHKNGTRIEVYYKDGFKDGPCQMYDENGKLTSTFTYKEDVLHGPSTQYNEQGGLFIECGFIDGALHGLNTVYYPSGMKMSETPFVKGKQHGEMLMYDEFGDLMQRVSYLNGLQQGQSTTYYPRSMGGGVSQVSFYDNGLLVNEQKMYYATGELFQQGRYANGRALEYPTSLDQSGKVMVGPANKNRV